MPLQQSFCYPCFQEEGVPLEKLFAEAKAYGYAATEFWFRGPEHDEVIAKAKAAGLAIASLCGHESLEDGMNKPENHDRIEAEIHASLEYATQHGISGLICFSGNRNKGQSDAEGMEVCAQILKKVAPAAEKAGVNLNVELLNSKVDHPGYQCDHTAWGVELCKRVGSPNVKLLYDIYHLQIMEGDLIRTLTESIDYIGHFHTAGNPARRDLDDQQEIYYPAVCRAINATGYNLYLGHEFSPRGDKIEGLKAAFRQCQV